MAISSFDTTHSERGNTILIQYSESLSLSLSGLPFRNQKEKYVDTGKKWSYNYIRQETQSCWNKIQVLLGFCIPMATTMTPCQMELGCLYPGLSGRGKSAISLIKFILRKLRKIKGINNTDI